MEFSKLWRNPELPDVELLKASFQTFEFSKHWHDELAIGLIESGAEGLNYRGKNLVIPAQHMVAINPGEVHTGFSGSDTGWTYRMFYFDTAIIQHYFDQNEVSVLPFIEHPILSDPELFQLMLQLHTALEEPSLNISKETLLAQAFELLFSRHGNRGSHKAVIDSKQEVYLARDFLMEHWSENIPLDALESLTGLTRFQLIRGFNRQFGCSPHQLLLLTKVLRAKKLLQQGDTCIEAALACGFFDQSHLTRNFKRVFGVPPKQYAVNTQS